MIRYEEYARIHYLYHERKLRIGQIAAELKRDEKTVSTWLKRARYQPRRGRGRSSKLDAYKGQVKAWLENHEYSAQQILQHLRELGYTGGYTTVKEYVRKVRPRPVRSYLTLAFAPGECAQMDWGHCGTVAVGGYPAPTELFCHGFMLLAADVCAIYRFAAAGGLSAMP